MHHRRDARFNVMQVLHRWDDNPSEIDDRRVLLEVSGRVIGRSFDRERLYYVLDGRVYCVWPGVDIASMDYYDFCSVLREKVPPGQVLDFDPADDFHLGRPPASKPTGECSAQPMTPDAAERAGPPPLAQRLAKQQRQGPPFVLRISNGVWVKGFNNADGALETTTVSERYAKQFPTHEAANEWGGRYCTGYLYHVDGVPREHVSQEF